MLYVVCKYVFRPIVWLLFRPVYIGRENLNVKGKAIFVFNHISMIDPVVVLTMSPRNVHFMAKAELFRGWLGNIFFKALLAFPVERGKTDMVSVKKAMRVLNNGKVFGIFPEGKRSITGDIDELEKGAAFLACRAAAPIVPMYIHKDSYAKMRVVMAVGEPIDVKTFMENTPKSKQVDELTNEIEKAFLKLKAEVEAQ